MRNKQEEWVSVNEKEWQCYSVVGRIHSLRIFCAFLFTTQGAKVFIYFCSVKNK